ncbi:hypothetical protein BN7_3366 [Wickerhamomyces ciferrii]|uniref:RNB domain-containing protein n=1 Tax=Wickerhamomyces ciferrii (strain ATCC 14091 / BCRC 22168 / CBS 111 / JCM 3599 / NBRC 0793 / NRRL Y-1031 F-60-10) TaxID=1206466 RepID=K0KNS3_WICCF|nr:uncharacterized protein BN7_3366 [Wickerhamomyces ciferrii]CCH43812.1 hypothetical protein BN7_3366 [Wickerhamomyces ciferrii]
MLRLYCSTSSVAKKVPLRCFSTSIRLLQQDYKSKKNIIGNEISDDPKYVKEQLDNVVSNLNDQQLSEEDGNSITRSKVDDAFKRKEHTTNQSSNNNKDDKSHREEIYSSVDNILQSDFFQKIQKTQAIDSKTLKEIIPEEVERFDKKFKSPTFRWMKKVHQDLRDKFDVEKIDNIPFTSLLEKYYGKPKFFIKATEIFDTLEVGDAVEFSKTLDQSVMSVIVQLPSRDDDPRYTVMDRKGTLHFCEKSSFKLRIPKVIPKEWINGIVERTNLESSGYGSVKTTVDHQYELYAVNPLARRTIVGPLLQITNDAWDWLPDVSQQLEVIHRLCQGNGPKQITLFHLYHAVRKIPLKNMKGGAITGVDSYQALNKRVQHLGSDFNIFGDSGLGKSINSLDPEAAYDVPLLYSITLALKKQNTLWSTSYTSRSAMLPLSVTVNPLEYVHRAESAIHSLKTDSELRESFADYIEKRDFTNVPKEFENILFLLKEYSVGNITDPVSESVICQLTKLPENLLDLDVTKTKIYNLLSEIGYIDTKLTNPVHFSNNLCMPGKDVSLQADRERDFYELSDETLDKDFDISKDIRKDFGDMKVYCIDSETAHEIDDGVAIERIDDKTANIHIHIADPASYLSPENSISKIAFERAFTTYQPETISAMLPMSLVNLSGLGIEGQKTRVMTFSVPFNFETGKVDLSKAEVQPSYVSSFPKYTYNTVDKTLLKTKYQDASSLNDEERDLNDLFKIAQKLRESRVEQGAVIFGESFGTDVKVLPKSENDAESDSLYVDSSMDDYNIVFGKQKSTDSQLLVSELMILANTISGSVLKENSYPGIYKGMRETKSTGSASEVINNMNKMIKEGSLPMLKDIARSIKFIVPAIYSHQPNRHLMLACDTYAPSTSPLRRFGDLVNHWQFHNMARAKPSRFTEAEMFYMTLHIEVRNDILKYSSRRAVSYYCTKYISEQIEKGNRLDLSFFTWSRPNGRYVSGIIPEFGLFARLKLERDSRPPKVGSVIKNFEIDCLDPISGDIELKQI